jgi:antitoxin component YwqK of YwqJK toxin-antitoxin module
MRLNDWLKYLGVTFILIGSALALYLIMSAPSKNIHTHHFISFSGVSYQEGSPAGFTGRVIDTVNNKIIEYEVQNGMRNGEFIISHRNGQIEVQGHIKNNRNEGEWRYFYSTGELETIGSFKNDKPHSNWSWYYKNGKLKETGSFNNGERNGVWIIYNEDGTMKRKITFSKGKEVNNFIPLPIQHS